MKSFTAFKKQIPGCNSYKKTDFQNLKVATLSLKILILLILIFSGNFRRS
jgi:hypothetical protein